jgi:ribonuclease Z
MIGFKQIDVICFTHFHADHISGLPGLLLTIGNAERTEPLLMVGPKRLEKVVNSLRVIAPELPFEIRFQELSEAEESFMWEDLRVDAFRVNHNVTCYGYSLSLPRTGKFSVDRARENEIPMKYWNGLQKGNTYEEDGHIYTPDMVLGPDRKGLKLTYCTDTRPTPLIEKYAAGSDLFICEGMYGEKEKEIKAIEHKHMMMQEAAAIAAKADVGEMWLTHYSPSHTTGVFSRCVMRHRALMRFYQSFPTAIPLYEAGYPRVTHPSATKSAGASSSFNRSTCMC